MIKFLQIQDNERRKIYQNVSNEIGVPPQAVEKDVWVTLMLRMVFSSVLAPHFIFKGGTSLSKVFNLINRFSEDVDLAIDGKLALENRELFESIIAHRKVLTPMKSTNYDTLTLESINIVPPKEHLDNYKADYKEMIETMIQGGNHSFEGLLDEILEQLHH
jgi:predicted nucleotidyltransferase component of viral defense system